VVKLKPKQRTSFNPDRGPLLSVRFAVALLLIAAGIAWIAYYYIGVRAPEGFDPKTGQAYAETGWKFMRDLDHWNYLIGFGLILLGLIVSAHRSTPLGRGRGVVVGMLGCFIIGLAWICVFYAVANGDSQPPVINDLGNKNLFVGVAFMAVGFSFATKWE